MITIAFAGRVNLGWGVSARAQRHGPEYPWGAICREPSRPSHSRWRGACGRYLQAFQVKKYTQWIK